MRHALSLRDRENYHERATTRIVEILRYLIDRIWVDLKYIKSKFDILNDQIDIRDDLRQSEG